MKSPPMYPNFDQADISDPVIEGVIFLSSSNRGSFNEWEFKIDINKKKIAVNNLFISLNYISTFSLADHSRGDFESIATYSKIGDEYLVQLGGHGWSAHDEKLNKLRAIATARKRVKYNLGLTNCDIGTIRITKQR